MFLSFNRLDLWLTGADGSIGSFSFIVIIFSLILLAIEIVFSRTFELFVRYSALILCETGLAAPCVLSDLAFASFAFVTVLDLQKNFSYFAYNFPDHSSISE